MGRKRSPALWLLAVVATSALAAGYEVYKYLTKEEDGTGRLLLKNYTNKSIALTLLHLVLSSELPLNDILLKSDNVTFILPPHLSLDDLVCNINNQDSNCQLPQTLIKNYKLLKCSNIQGFFHIIRNLRPDMLLVCADDLGIDHELPKDLTRFVKDIVTLDQNKDEVSNILTKVFLR